MTSVTQRAVCEHSLLIMQNMPYGLFSMQHGSFELSDCQTRVLHKCIKMHKNLCVCERQRIRVDGA